MPEREELLTEYNRLNNSFNKKAVFFVGHSAGLFSELNNMILAIHYCLDNNIKFELYSKTANFRDKNGWTDYFEPFVNEFRKKIPNCINKRTRSQFENKLTHKFKLIFFKLVNNVDFLTFEFFDKFYSDAWLKICNKSSFTINEKERLQKTIKMIWKFNVETQATVNEKISAIKLPSGEYASIHIRGGDKILECSTLYESDDLMNELIKKTNCKNVYVFCDDYSSFEYLKENYKDYHFYTLCGKEEKGYNNSEFHTMDKSVRKNMMTNLFAHIEICINSAFFIGTEQANTDYFISWVMPNHKQVMLPAYKEEYVNAKSF